MHKTYTLLLRSLLLRPLSSRPAFQNFLPKSSEPRRLRPIAWRWSFILVLLLVLGLLSFPWLWRFWVNFRYAPSMYTAQEFLQQSAMADGPSPAIGNSGTEDSETNGTKIGGAEGELRVAIVFGARVYSSGRLSAMLRDRVDTAVDLYHAGMVDKILLSGGQAVDGYDEPGAMMTYALARDVAAGDIQPDYGGRRTYDTCYRAVHIFQVEDAVLITQAFHLPRALFLCDHLGMRAAGVEADRRIYDPRSVAWSETRELPALVAALIDLVRRTPPPVLGEPIPLD